MTHRRNILVAIIIMGASCESGFAQTSWIAGTGDWFTPGNWSLGVPNSNSQANISNGGTAQIEASVAFAEHLRVGLASGSGHLDISGGQLLSTGTFHVNEGGIGPSSVTVHDGGAVASGSTIVGHSSAASSDFTISGLGTSYNVAGQFDVGFSGVGTATLIIESGAVLESSSGGLAGFAGSTGNVTIRDAGSRWASAGSLSVGGNGTGTLTLESQGTMHVGSQLSINSASTVNLNGGRLRANSITGVERINYNSGTIQLAGNRVLNNDPTISALYTGLTTIPAEKELTIEGNATITDNAFQVFVNGGQLTLQAGLDVAGILSLRNGGVASSASANIGQTFGNAYVTVSGPGSTLDVADDLYIGSPNGGTLTIHDEGLVRLGDQLNIGDAGIVDLVGGTLRMGGFNKAPGGVFNYHSGTIQLAGDHNIGADASINRLFGIVPTIVASKGLVVEGTAIFWAPLIVDGGTFTAGALESASELHLISGALNVTSQITTIGPGGTLGGELDLARDMSVTSTQGTINTGLVRGDGQIGGTFTNGLGGELRAEPGQSLTFTGGPNNFNHGQTNLYGGQLEFTQSLTNSTTGRISGNGTLIAKGGLTNFGVMNFSGLANISGDATNASGALIISSGGGPTTFFDDVVNDGELRTSAGGFTTFFGGVTGNGTFTGSGTVNLEGDLDPGSSPAALAFEGNVSFGPAAQLNIELGGLLAGSEHDQLLVAGNLTLDGTLNVSLIDGFTPVAGHSFDILNWGALSGAFSSFALPALNGLQWDTSQLYATGVITVVPILDADFDEDGDVDSNDLVEWRNGFGISGAAAHGDGDADGDLDVDGRDLLAWQRQLGMTTSLSATMHIPEPATSVLFGVLLGLTRLLSKHSRFANCSET